MHNNINVGIDFCCDVWRQGVRNEHQAWTMNHDMQMQQKIFCKFETVPIAGERT